MRAYASRLREEGIAEKLGVITYSPLGGGLLTLHEEQANLRQALRWSVDTGEVAVHECVAADDVGRVIHPVLAEGQVEGGTLQAVGYATIEEMKLVDGGYLNDRLATYLIPTSLDAPRIRTILIEKPYSGAPHGAKGVGELPMDVGAPAVVAAIHDAVGAWIHDLPATPERVLAALTNGPMPPPPGISQRSTPPGEPEIEDLPPGEGDEMPLRGPQP